MAKVIKDTPDEPIAYLIKTLKKMYSEGSSKVFISYFILIIITKCLLNYNREVNLTTLLQV